MVCTEVGGRKKHLGMLTALFFSPLIIQRELCLDAQGGVSPLGGKCAIDGKDLSSGTW